MGDYQILPGHQFDRLVSYSYIAEWQCLDAPVNREQTALTFDPKPWSQRQGLIRADPWDQAFNPKRSIFTNKPAVYAPVKRTDGTDRCPTLAISIKLVAPRVSLNHQVPAWAGTGVEVEVVNLLAGQNGSPEAKLALSGTLGQDLACAIQVKPDDVKAWLGPTLPLKAVVNENLLDFRFKLPGVIDDGQPLVGQSRNRLFLYCRKTVVFLPGLFASQIQFKTADGETVGFPDFWNERTIAAVNESGPSPSGAPPINLAAYVPDIRFQRVDVLECDDKGVPLIPCPKPTLLMLRTFRFLFGRDVIEAFNSLHNARVAMLPHVPSDFRLYTLIIYPYDWRGDLTDAAAMLIKRLDELKNGNTGLAKAPDTDDQVAIMGHSTGGVVIRRALATIEPSDCTSSLEPAIKNASRPKAEGLISLVFFLSVPFAGAPKAGAVILTGREVPEGDRQIPFVVPESMVAVALSMPIVYHLHTTAGYLHRPSTSPSRPPRSTGNNEDYKAAFVKDTLTAGLMPRPWLVRADLATNPDDRKQLALGAQAWHELIAEYHERLAGLSIKYATEDPASAANWFQGEIQKRGLQSQKNARKVGGWNTYLADRARVFHEESGKAIAGDWPARSCILWGTCGLTPTLRQLNLSKVSTHTYDDEMSFRRARLTELANRQHPMAVPRIYTYESGGLKGGSKEFAQWRPDGKKIAETIWRLEWVQQYLAGDGTVPSDSQLAEVKKVKASLLTHADGEAPKHMNSTKSDNVWRALLMSIHGGGIVAETERETTARKSNEHLPPPPIVVELPFFE